MHPIAIECIVILYTHLLKTFTTFAGCGIHKEMIPNAHPDGPIKLCYSDLVCVAEGSSD